MFSLTKEQFPRECHTVCNGATKTLKRKRSIVRATTCYLGRVPYNSINDGRDVSSVLYGVLMNLN